MKWWDGEGSLAASHLGKYGGSVTQEATNLFSLHGEVDPKYVTGPVHVDEVELVLSPLLLTLYLLCIVANHLHISETLKT